MATTDPSAAPADPAAPTGAEILVIVAHPELEQSRANRRLLQAARALERKSPPGRLAVRDLYALYPDYLIDIAVEQAALKAARLVVWQQPVRWYGMPPLLKLWLDDVLTFGWAYGPGGDALRGKDLWLVASTGGAEDSYRPDGYNRYFVDAFLPPYEQTAALCGLRFLPPLLLHGAHRASPAEIEQHVQVFGERLASYPDWPEMAELEACPACVVPMPLRRARAAHRVPIGSKRWRPPSPRGRWALTPWPCWSPGSATVPSIGWPASARPCAPGRLSCWQC
jgi:glutathione-regulated potassium-efflux system ancillary protein KefF